MKEFSFFLESIALNDTPVVNLSHQSVSAPRERRYTLGAFPHAAHWTVSLLLQNPEMTGPAWESLHCGSRVIKRNSPDT